VTTIVRTARFVQLSPLTLYRILKLRVDVFIVEQECPYPELDGRDDEPGTLHVWASTADDPDRPLAYLRLLTEPDGTARIGRVVTAPPARGNGLAGTLVETALQHTNGPCVLNAQSHLTRFYERFGFHTNGAEFLDDGIPHVPMTRPATAAR
jgi:ElaA protein